MSFNSNNRTLKRWGCRNDSSNENLSVRCNNDNCKVNEIHSNLRLCTRYSTCFFSECCGIDQQIICLLNNRTDNYWFCLNYAKLPLNAVFAKKDVEERCAIFLESICKRVMTKSTKNLKKLLIFYPNAHNMINKRNEIQSWFRQKIRPYFVLPKLCQKTFYWKLKNTKFK